MKLSLLVFFFFSFAAQATCMVTCHDTDAGMDPAYFGVVIEEVSCAAPGGPVHTSKSYYLDECREGIHTEQSCRGDIREPVTVTCRKCSDAREGVCEEF